MVFNLLRFYFFVYEDVMMNDECLGGCGVLDIRVGTLGTSNVESSVAKWKRVGLEACERLVPKLWESWL